MLNDSVRVKRGREWKVRKPKEKMPSEMEVASRNKLLTLLTLLAGLTWFILLKVIYIIHMPI